jgi:general secretion pathway protein G
MHGNRFDFSFVFTALEKSALADMGSKEKTDIVRVAKHLDPESGIAFVLGMDPPAMFKRFGPMLEHLSAAYPEPMRPMFATSMASWEKLAPVMGTAMCTNMDISPTGLRGTTYFRPSDAKAWSDAYIASLKTLSMPGFEVRGPEQVTVDGVAVSQFTLEIHDEAIDAMLRKKGGEKLDDAVLAPMKAMLKRFYGEHGMRFAFATKGNDGVMVIGGDDAHLHRAIAGLGDADKKLPPDVQHEIDGVAGANPCFVARIDFARIMGDVMAFAAIAAPDHVATPKESKGPPAPIMFHGAIDGRVWRGGTSCDLAQVVKASKAAFEQSEVGDKTRSARRGKALADIASIHAAINEYAINNGGKYPETLAVLVTPDANGHAYLASKAVPRDPWGNEYHYEFPSPGHPEPRVISYGADGKPGGEGEDADIEEGTPAPKAQNVEKTDKKK